MPRPNITLTVDQRILDDYKQLAREQSAKQQTDVPYQQLMRDALTFHLFDLQTKTHQKKGKE
jgi:hypothetical protein